MPMAPLVPSFTMTRLGTFCPGPKFRFDEFGRATRSGKTVRYEPLLALVMVTFVTTPVAPTGTPPCPTTGTERNTPPGEPCGHGVVNGPTLLAPGRLSRMRPGDSTWK